MNKYVFYEIEKDLIELKDPNDMVKVEWPKITCKFNYTVQGVFQGSTNPAKFTFVFSDWNDTPSVPTAIDEANSVETFDPSNGEWYNMNGQKLNGIPATKGLYIMNGKKVVVK